MEAKREPVPTEVFRYTLGLTETEVDQLIYIMGLNVSIPEKFGVEKSEFLNRLALGKFMSAMHAMMNKTKHPRKKYA